jgi:hypothetical protein
MLHEGSMIKIQTLLKVGDDLVPVEQFVGPIPDEDYIEGSLELSVGSKPILTREQVDYPDQLWAYLIEGLEEVVAGRDFSTYYPDMPVKIVLRPQGERVTINVDTRNKIVEASVPIHELCSAMASAGTTFFERLRQFTPSNRPMYDGYLVRLKDLSRV